MFNVGDTVLCNCGAGGIPIGTQGVIKAGPNIIFGKSLYEVKCPGFASSLQNESCLTAIALGANSTVFLNVGDTVTLEKTQKTLQKGILGIIASEPRNRLGKVFYDVYFDGHDSHITVNGDKLRT